MTPASDRTAANLFTIAVHVATTPKKRRKYALGRCQDCGYEKNVTTVKFWATGMLYRVCGQCIRPYRGVINSP